MCGRSAMHCDPPANQAFGIDDVIRTTSGCTAAWLLFQRKQPTPGSQVGALMSLILQCRVYRVHDATVCRTVHVLAVAQVAVQCARTAIEHQLAAVGPPIIGAIPTRYAALTSRQTTRSSSQKYKLSTFLYSLRATQALCSMKCCGTSSKRVLYSKRVL